MEAAPGSEITGVPLRAKNEKTRRGRGSISSASTSSECKGMEKGEEKNRKRKRRRGNEMVVEEAGISLNASSSDAICTKHTGELPDKSDPSFERYLDEVLCPICMEHPHNAVMLCCDSANQGCRTFICKTSDRHSNCFNQLRKSSQVNSSSEVRVGVNGSIGNAAEQNYLRCPHCRGKLYGATVVEGVREYLDQKVWSCSDESCQFSGNYRELRKHARRDHPMSRPREVDPSRMEAWQRLERQQEVSDTLSAIRSAMPRTVVLGDAGGALSLMAVQPSRLLLSWCKWR